MARATNGLDSKASSRRRVAATGPGQDSRIGRDDPRSRAVNRSTRADRFVAFSDEVRRDLNPRGPLEALMAEHVVQSAWRLKGTLDRQVARDLRDESDPDGPRESPRRASTPAADRAARSVRDALESLDYLRDRRAIGRDPAVPLAAIEDVSSGFVPNEWPVVPFDLFDEVAIDPEPESAADEAPDWRDRLVFDFDISDISPVVKGTWITVGHVVSLVVDGWTWADILRSHPELAESDIRTCLNYAMAEENQEG